MRHLAIIAPACALVACAGAPPQGAQAPAAQKSARERAWIVTAGWETPLATDVRLPATMGYAVQVGAQRRVVRLAETIGIDGAAALRVVGIGTPSEEERTMGAELDIGPRLAADVAPFGLPLHLAAQISVGGYWTPVVTAIFDLTHPAAGSRFHMFGIRPGAEVAIGYRPAGGAVLTQLHVAERCYVGNFIASPCLTTFTASGSWSW